MNVNVDQRCPSCGTGIHDEAELEAVTGVGGIEDDSAYESPAGDRVGMLREVTANWECPDCGVAYDQTFPVDMAMVDRSGFESWVGSVEDEPLCLIVKDEADVVEDEGSSVREDGKRRFGRT
jgi:rubredoxin